MTLSTEQLEHSRELAAKHGVADRVEFRFQNYQDLAGETFDAIYSIGMYEAVGRHNGHHYLRRVSELLRDGGVSVLHTVTKQGKEGGQPWFNTYIFPGAYVPAAYEVLQHLALHGFRIIHAENLRLHYARTLREWYHRFAQRRDDIIEIFDEQFVRMWTFYLLTCAGSFRYGAQDLFQFTFTKGANNEIPAPWHERAVQREAGCAGQSTGRSNAVA